MSRQIAIRRTTRPFVFVVAFGLASAIVSQVTHAALLVPTFQERQISAGANAGGPTDNDGAAAADFNRFNQVVSAFDFVPPPWSASALGLASQDSDILDDSLIGIGAANASASAGVPGAGGQSNFLVNFTLTEAANYTLTGELDINDLVISHGVVDFSNLDTSNVIFVVDTAVDPAGTFSDAGTLASSNYSLIVSLDVLTLDGHAAPSDSFAFNLSFDPVPEPASLSLFALGSLVLRWRRRR